MADTSHLKASYLDSLTDVASSLADGESSDASSISVGEALYTEEPPPLPRHLFVPVRTAIAVKTTTASGKPLPIECFEAAITTPSTKIEQASLCRAPDGRLHLTYHPTAAGEHTLQLRFRGTAVGPPRPLTVRPGIAQRRPWVHMVDDERQGILGWLSRRLRAAGLDAVLGVCATELRIEFMAYQELGSKAGQAAATKSKPKVISFATPKAGAHAINHAAAVLSAAAVAEPSATEADATQARPSSTTLPDSMAQPPPPPPPPHGSNQRPLASDAPASKVEAAPLPKPIDRNVKLIGVVPPGRAAERWASLQDAVRRALPHAGDASFAVLAARQEWQRGDGQVQSVPLQPEEARRQLQQSYSRGAGPLRLASGPLALSRAAEDLLCLATAFADASRAALPKVDVAGAYAEGEGLDGVPPAALELVAFTEQWVHSGSAPGADGDGPADVSDAEAGAAPDPAKPDTLGAVAAVPATAPVPAVLPLGEFVVGLQLEGCAPLALRPALEAAAAAAARSSSEGDTFPRLEAFGPLEHLRSVVWYRTHAQGCLHFRRRAAALAAGLPIPRDPLRWLEHTDAFCASKVPGGLGGLVARRMGPSLPAPRGEDDWRRGRQLLSQQSPRIEYYPQFLSEAEAEHLLALAYLHVQPVEEDGEAAAASTDAVSSPHPQAAGGPKAGSVVAWSEDKAWAKHRMLVSAPKEDPVTQLVEERCALATGVPRHRLEAGLAMKHAHAAPTPPPEGHSPRVMPSLHVDTNNQGRYRCATVIMYLNDVPEGRGGETRFPIAQAPEDSPLRSAGRACLASGATALFRSEAAQKPHSDPDAQAILDAAERSDVGVHIRPRKGAACVFWTMDKNGVDPSSWHNGAKVLYGGGGKWIAQKFKELEVRHRTEPLSLPSAYEIPLPV